MEKNPINLSREATWYALNKTGMANLAKSAINSFVPSRHVQDLLRSHGERQKRRETIILQGAGELELQCQKGLMNLDDETREKFWVAVKSGTTGVEFGDIFDPHVAEILEITTPCLPETDKQ